MRRLRAPSPGHLFLPGSTSPFHSKDFLPPPHLKEHREMGVRGWGQFITICFCPCSGMVSLPEDTVLHELSQRGSSPWGTLLQEQADPVWTTQGLQFLPENLLLPAPFTSTSFLWETCNCCSMWYSMGYSVDMCSGVGLHGLQGDNLFHHGLLHRLQGNVSSGTWSTSTHSLLTELGAFTDFFSLRFSYFSLAQLLCSIF